MDVCLEKLRKRKGKIMKRVKENKTIIKALSLMMAICMVFTLNLNIANAASTTVDYDSKETITEIVPKTLTTGTDADFKSKLGCAVITYDGTDNVPLKMTSNGVLAYYFGADEANTSLGIYSDAACTASVSTSYSASTVDTATNGYYSETKYVYLDKGTYYVKPEKAGMFDIYTCVFDSNDRTLKNKEWAIAAPKNYDSSILFKVKAAKQSKLTVSFDKEYASSYGYTVTLLNSKKKAISEASSVSSATNEAYYAVPKGTYYIKVKTGNTAFRIKSTIAAAKDSTGSAKAKAKAMKVNGSKVAGVFTTSDKTSNVDWVKFTNSKAQKTYVYIDYAFTSGKLKMEFFSSNGKSMGTKTIYPGDATDGANLYTIGAGYSGDKLAKGTYYVKIKKASSKTSASYKVYVKTKNIFS